MTMRPAVVSVVALITAFAACGDDEPARDVVDARDSEVAVDSDGAVEADVGEVDVTVEVEDDTEAPDVADTSDTGDTAVDTIDPDATPEQRAILAVPESARFELAGLSAPVHVVRTEGSMPHIYAASRADLGRVLGFVQARDRFFFMDMERRLGQGNVAELLGAIALPRDIESRGTGLPYITDRLVAHLSPEMAEYLTAFADGVNDYIDAVRREALPSPTEMQYHGVLGYASPADMMKPFTLRDAVALLAVLLVNTNFEGDDVGTTAEAERLDGLFAGATDEALRKSGYLVDVWNDVRPMFPGSNSTAGFGVGKRAGTREGKPHRGKAQRPLPAGMARRLFERLEARERRMGKDREAGFGSNVWAVSGEKTKDGAAILANDGHLDLSVPGVAYGFGLDTRVFGGGDLHQMGGSLAHVPLAIGGTNGDVAWGGVNPVEDITDWYREELQLDAAGKPKASLFKGEWRDLVATDESYVVADVPLLQSVGRTEVWTRWVTFDGRWIASVEGRSFASLQDAGEDADRAINVLGDLVVPEDIDEDGVISAISFDYVAFDATQWAEAHHRVGVSHTVEEAREAMRGYVGGGLFWSVVDGTGSILYSTYQAIPCRAYLPRGDDGIFVAGADPTRLIDGTEYGGFTIPTDAAGKADEAPGARDPYKCVVPHAEMPYALDPPSGFVFGANNDPAGITDDGEERNDAYHIGGPWASVRANTIRRDLQRVTADSQADVAALVAMQANIESRLGEVFTPYLVAAIDKAAAATEGPLMALYSPRLDEARERLAAWGAAGYHARAGVETFYLSPTAQDRSDAVATMIFNAYVRRFFAAVWDDENINAWRAGSEERVAALMRFLAGRGPDNPDRLGSWNPATEEAVFFDRLGTERIESSDELMVQALVDALAYLESAPTGPGLDGFGTADMDQWLWGLRHQVKFESFIGGFIGDNPALAAITEDFSYTTERIPLMAGLPPGDPRRGLKWFPRGGDQWSVDAANPGIGGGDFTHGAGPVMRLVVALKDGTVRGRFILHAGQSGIVDSPYFDDQPKLWLANDYFPFRFTPSEVAEGALGRELYLPE